MHFARRTALALCSFAAVATLVLASGCRSPEEGTISDSVHVGGQQRTFLYHPPPGGAAKKYPLVVALHGRGGDGTQAESGTNLTTIADREGFVVAYPDGVDRSWHDRRGVGPAAEQGVDDVAFIRALIDKMIAEHNVDPQRVYVTGTSNGGMMTFRLACDLSEKIAAVGVVIGLMPENGVEECKPTHPMPIAMFVGTEDPLIPYGGGDVVGGPIADRGRVLSAEASRDRWARLNGCEPIDVEQTIDPVDDDTRVLKTAHTRCQKGSEVVLYSIDKGGHTWPNGDQYLPKAVIGKVTRDIDGGEELWQFFKRHSFVK